MTFRTFVIKLNKAQLQVSSLQWSLKMPCHLEPCPVKLYKLPFGTRKGAKKKIYNCTQ